jgi:hypothetical protein
MMDRVGKRLQDDNALGRCLAAVRRWPRSQQNKDFDEDDLAQEVLFQLHEEWRKRMFVGDPPYYLLRTLVGRQRSVLNRRRTAVGT